MTKLKLMFNKTFEKKKEIIENEMIYYQNLIQFYQDNKKNINFGIYKTLKIANQEISILLNKLKHLNIPNVDGLKLFIEYDLVRYDLETILRKFRNIVINLNQHVAISFFQYLPQFVFNRSYSYKAVHEYWQYELQKIINGNFLQNTVQDVSYDRFIHIYWNFAHEFRHSDNYIITNFYYQDMPHFLPIIAHEAGHIMIYNNYNLQTLKKEIIEQISNLFNYDNLLRSYEEVSEEILADFIAYYIYGDAYLLSILEEIGTLNFRYFKDNNYILINDLIWIEISFLRLFFLIDARREIFNKKNDLVEEVLKNYEKVIYELKYNYNNKNTAFSNLFNTYFEIYNKVRNFLVSKFKKDFKIIQNLLKDCDCKEDIYLKVWEEVLNEKSNIKDYSGLYRKLVIKDISKRFKDKNLIHKALIFGKLRIKDIGIETIQNVYKNKNLSFGIFNFIEIKEMEGYKEESSEGKWFTQKNLLIELDRQENGENKGDFNIIVMLDINGDYYDNFDKIIGGILDKIKRYLNTFKFNYEIYKSLGPKEIVIKVNNISIKDIFSIKNELSKKGRTHSIIFLNKNLEKIEVDEEHFIKLLIRIKQDENDSYKENLFIFLKNKGYNFECIYTPGIYDYEIRIRNKEIRVNDIFLLMATEFISDMQIKIEKQLKFDN